MPCPSTSPSLTSPLQKESSSTRALPHAVAGGAMHRTLPFVYVAATSRSPDHFCGTPSNASDTADRPNRHFRSGRPPRRPEPCTTTSPPP